jgi:hypothetical protein
MELAINVSCYIRSLQKRVERDLFSYYSDHSEGEFFSEDETGLFKGQLRKKERVGEVYKVLFVPSR